MTTEKFIKIKTHDGKLIAATQRGSFSKPVIVIVHGLAGNMNEALHFNAARYFEHQGFSSLRVNLYHWQQGYRKLHECTFSTHGKDIDTVLKYLAKHGAKRIFLVGHSFGWPSILHTKERNFLAVAPWDGSRLPYNQKEFAKRSRSPKGRIIDEGYWVIMGDRMAEDSHRVNSIGLVSKFERPISFITVDDNVFGNWNNNKKMHQAARVKKELVVIRGAHHTFSEEGKQEELYAATVKWFKRFI
jgi:dienelactone hydrolase